MIIFELGLIQQNEKFNCFTVMKRENVAKSYMVKISKKTAFTEHFWLKIGTLMAMSHHPNG